MAFVSKQSLYTSCMFQGFITLRIIWAFFFLKKKGANIPPKELQMLSLKQSEGTTSSVNVYELALQLRYWYQSSPV